MVLLPAVRVRSQRLLLRILDSPTLIQDYVSCSTYMAHKNQLVVEEVEALLALLDQHQSALDVQKLETSLFFVEEMWILPILSVKMK